MMVFSTPPRVQGQDQGALTLPFAIGLSLLALAGMGSLGLLKRSRNLMNLQLQLDQCVGQKARELGQRLERLEEANQQMRDIREALNTSSAPGAEIPLRSRLDQLAQQQNLEQEAWQKEPLFWQIPLKCHSSGDQPEPLPPMHWPNWS
ncbi:hypothetical protein WDW37_11945, partial [Bdellovibrionota bacterium FG-1]